MKELEQLKKEIQHTRQRVMEVTGYTADDVSAMVFEGAYEWLEAIGSDAYGMEHLPKTSEFWGFFKREWHFVDTQFVQFIDAYQIYEHLGRKACRDYYAFYHQPRQRFMNTANINARYHQLVKELAIKR